MSLYGMRGARAALVALVAVLPACSSMGDTDMSPGAILSGGRDLEAERRTVEQFAVVTVCPEIQVRDGTQMLRIFERGRQDDMSAIRFQATVQKFARECRTDPATGVTSIKVGVAGRMLSGPSGATGTVNLPLRIVLVKNGDEVLYSQLHPTAAEIPAGQASVLWTQVVDGITIPQQPEGRYVIYIGFDEAAQS